MSPHYWIAFKRAMLAEGHPLTPCAKLYAYTHELRGGSLLRRC